MSRQARVPPPSCEWLADQAIARPASLFHFLSAERDTRAVAGAKSRRIGQPIAHPSAMISVIVVRQVEYARLPKAGDHSLGQIATKTGIAKTYPHRHLTGSKPRRTDLMGPFRELVLTSPGRRDLRSPGSRVSGRVSTCRPQVTVVMRWNGARLRCTGRNLVQL
jgi:hypothetical protein